MISKRFAISPLLIDQSSAMTPVRQRLVDGADVPGEADPLLGVVVELNLRKGLPPDEVVAGFRASFATLPDSASRVPYRVTAGHLRCLLRRSEISRLLLADWGTDEQPGPRTIFRIWPDYVLRPHIDRSCVTIKADAAGRTYRAVGADVVWAVLDTGIDRTHPHFAAGTLDDARVANLHRDFTWLVRREPPPAHGDAARLEALRASALVDESGHGSHVAGIIAGRAPGAGTTVATLRPATGDEAVKMSEWPQWERRVVSPDRHLAGMAPEALLVSLKVLDGQSDPDGPRTTSSAVMAALAYVREVNAWGRALQIHGVNLSLGCDWHPADYAAGQSPLCREVNLLVASGVVTVISAGNTGAAAGVEEGEDSAQTHGSYASITEPGHAERAITVGATHRDSPHSFGVWFRSAKGPTLDGRRKPDLVAPGEKITSAATGRLRDRVPSAVWQEQVQSAGGADVGLAQGGMTGVEQPSTPEPAPPGPDGSGQGPAAESAGPVAVGADPPGAAGLATYAEESGTSMAAPHVSGAVAAFLSVRQEFVGQPDAVKALFCDAAVSLGRDPSFEGNGLVDVMAVLSRV